MLGRGTEVIQLAMRDDSAPTEDKNNTEARSTKRKLPVVSPSSPAVFPSDKHVRIGAYLLGAMTRFVARNPELFSLFLTAVFSVVVSKLAQNGGATQTTAVPLPIFPKGSPVYEFTDGNMLSATLEIQRGNNEFSFVMYYAHWDGNSRDVAVEFDKAARQLSHQVTFVAVNCWWMHGSCRRQISTQMYPALLVTVPSVRSGLQFTGIQHADEMLSFLRQILSPYTYITDMKAFYRLHAKHGAVVLGYFDSSSFPTPSGFATFQKAAWLGIEKDPIEPIAFAVVTNSRLAKSFGLQETRDVAIIRTLNSTMFYPKDATFKAKPIVEWAYNHREIVVQWLAPAGVKSTIMVSQIGGSPAVVLLTPHDDQQGLANNFYLLKEVALQYYNCGNTRHVRNLVRTLHRARDVDQKDCEDFEEASEDDYMSNDCDCCQTLANIPITMASPHGRNVCQVCEQSSGLLPHSCSPSHRHDQATMLNLIHGMASLVPNTCLHMNYYYSPFSRLQLCCMQCDEPQQHMCCQSEQCALTKRSAIKSDCHQVPNLANSDRKCQQTFKSTSGKTKWTSASSSTIRKSGCHSQSSPSDVFHAHLGQFTGLGCRTNRTVNFFAMRSEYFWVFAERLGIANISDFKNSGEKALVLLDIEAEQQHFLNEAVTTTAIKHFIFNYTMSNLTRHLRSSRHSIKPSFCGHASSICVQEVVSSTFTELVLDNEKDVLLLYYAPWCGFCKRMHHLYLMLAKVFQKSSNLIIARIDGDANDLPWHLTHTSYPALLMFPAGRKDRSQRFPTSSTLNLPNMIKFVLQHTTLLP
ncbi:thioredoxin domain-containing protein 11-like [Asterias rubens]|uniref:thioredoxin domain-containing protein 11-like n=1 Tax=Asterias rubens TaxID=7604 RepID=UPI001455519A|nr:thioredoxin domain-containing protein 11-like [Asterias rubens]